MQNSCRNWLSGLTMLVLVLVSARSGCSEEPSESAGVLLRQFCIDCHQDDSAAAGVDLESLTASDNIAAQFRVWRRVVEQLEQKLMPPESADAQPTDTQRRQLVESIRQRLDAAAAEHDGETGEVVIRRLTSAEYGYVVHDLTGVDIDVEHGFVSDAVGGAGFTNTGIVQFTQDSVLERYLEAAKQIADHTVVGTGPLEFFENPGATGFELSAINRILTIYRQHGFRTAAGEGGLAFGAEKYPQAFLTAWRYHHREQLGQPDATLEQLAQEAGIETRFAAYIFGVVTTDKAAFPTSIITDAWLKLPAPTDGNADEQNRVADECVRIADLLRRWQNRFGTNPDAKEEAPVLRADHFDVQRTQPFEMNVNWPQGTQAAHLVITVEPASGDGSPDAVVVWENAQIQFRDYAKRLADPQPLRMFLTDETVERLQFGQPLRGRTLAETDFATQGTQPLEFELPIPEGARSARLLMTAELDVERGDDCIVRCTISQLEETDQGKSVSGLLANPRSLAFSVWKAGVLEFARLLPQMSQREPAPSDRDPVPAPIDSSYNNAERNFFHTRIKYFRDDEFLVRNMLDDDTRRELDQAWADLKGSFEFHDTWLQVLADKYGFALDGRAIANIDEAWIVSLPDAARGYVRQHKADYDHMQNMFAAAESGHVRDVIHFAERAWRRPLSESEAGVLHGFYQSLRTTSGLDHRSAICATIARVLVAPGFLYRSETFRDGQNASDTTEPDDAHVALSSWEMASRLSFLLWSSVPDAELRRAAAANELQATDQISQQVRRMLADPKSRRFATEFFGQWFGFYRFHLHRGVDESQFPEFTPALRQAMYDEAIEFFDHIVRQDRPVDDILFADDAFLNWELATHYGIDMDVVSRADDVTTTARAVRRIPDAQRFQRGGLLKLGAILVTTSAPRRTSPVKRGDWILRRVLGAAVPPPPADAGSISADEVADDGATIRDRLIAHRRDASCHNCHSRFDAFGFALENFDAIGRWRTQYRDATPVETSGSLRGGREISGVDGLHLYLQDQLPQFHDTLATKLVGYALGRQSAIGDQSLIDGMKQHMHDGGSLTGLIEQIVTSRQFRYRR